jgi:hypothetical protein
LNGFEKGYFLFHLLRCESGDTANPSGVSKERNVIFGHGLNPLRRISLDRIGWMEALEWTGSERFREDVLLGWVISVIHGWVENNVSFLMLLLSQISQSVMSVIW